MFPKTRPSLHLESSGVPSLARSSGNREDPYALCSRVCTQELVDLPLAVSAISQRLPRSLLTSQADNSSICSDQRLPVRMAVRGEAFEGHSELAKFSCPASAAICSHWALAMWLPLLPGAMLGATLCLLGECGALVLIPCRTLGFRWPLALRLASCLSPSGQRTYSGWPPPSSTPHCYHQSPVSNGQPTGWKHTGETGVQLGHQKHGVGCSPARTVGS